MALSSGICYDFSGYNEENKYQINKYHTQSTPRITTLMFLCSLKSFFQNVDAILSNKKKIMVKNLEP